MSMRDAVFERVRYRKSVFEKRLRYFCVKSRVSEREQESEIVRE